jgi:F-type H+-transporting ATPase subunit delta
VPARTASCGEDPAENRGSVPVISSSVSRRYARALMTLGLEDGRFEAYAEELARVEAAFGASAELRDLWLNPAHPREQRLKAVDLLEKPLGLSPHVANTLRLVVERSRAAELPNLVRAFSELVDAQVGRVRAVVTSAAPMPAEVTGRLGGVLAQLTNKRIVLETKVDPGLIGGLTAQVGSMVYDGSLRTQLENLRETLGASRTA